MIYILITALLWGTTGTVATFAPGAGPLAIGSAALGIGGLLQALIAVSALRTEVAALRVRTLPIAAGALAVAIYPLAFYSSMHYAGVAIGSVVSLASAPIASALLERFISHNPLSRRWVLALLLGLGGSALLCLAKLTSAPEDLLSTLWGLGLGLVAGTSYAVYSWVAHRLMGAGISRAAAMGSVFGAGGLLLLPVLILTGAPLLASPQAFWVASYMALIPMFAGYLLFGCGLTRVSPSTATTITLVEPAVATLLAVAIVGEELSAVGWAGMVLLCAALALLAFPQRLPAVAPSPGAQP
ncbi:DMT family transporter [Rothia sp. P100]|uniref:DMT family transporter n=1 Tax=Rothia sp. P100 TaxID=2939578 RepID=UPI00203DAB03|nr:DMT family transporter [Rothia sp. P100]